MPDTGHQSPNHKVNMTCETGARKNTLNNVQETRIRNICVRDNNGMVSRYEQRSASAHVTCGLYQKWPHQQQTG